MRPSSRVVPGLILALAASACAKREVPVAVLPVVVVSAVAPLSGPYTGGTAITVTGSGFAAGAIVRLAGTRAGASRREDARFPPEAAAPQSRVVRSR